MGYWLKKFADGSQIRGTDEAVVAGAATWSGSRLDGMVEAEISHGGFTMSITGLGTYWQSDTYESIFPGPGSDLIQRRIERQIEPTDTHFRTVQRMIEVDVHFNGGLIEGGKYTKIESDWVGQWLILEYDIRSSTIRHYIKENRF